MSNHYRWLRFGVWLACAAAILLPFFLTISGRAEENQGFNVQVSPSPLFVTLKPGESKSTSLTVRNLSSHPETLIPKLQGFTIDRSSEKIELTDDSPANLNDWVGFKQNSLTLEPGQSKSLEIIYNTPGNVGFSYALAIVLSPKDKPEQESGATIDPKVAVFNLINISRDDAKKELKIEGFTSKKSRYDFLPVSFSLLVKNKGNVIDQPSGNIFIQRGFDDAEPIATLPINKQNGYILPELSRSFDSEWNGGFPRFVKKDGKNELKWEWKGAGNFRFGKYIAKAVLVYNDGQRDIPLVASVSFWVIPWKLILIFVLMGGLVITGLVFWIRIVIKGTRKVGKYARRHH